MKKNDNLQVIKEEIMKRIVIAAIIVLLFIVFLSCSQEGNPLNNGDTGKDYLPVKVGAN